MSDPKNTDQDEPQPWWASDSSDEAPLPEGFPERPDAKKVDVLRQQLKNDKHSRTNPTNAPAASKYATKVGKQARDIGAYTLIPSLMLAGPAVGYGLGWLVEKQWGGAPWTSVFGLLFGLVAAFRQIFIILAKKARADQEARSTGSPLKTERKPENGSGPR